MQKEKRNVAIVVIAILVLLSVLVHTKVIPLSIGGFSTLSLSQISVDSNDASIAGKTWFLTVSQDGAGQYATATNQIIKDNQKGATSNSFTIKTSLDEFYATYNINNQGVPIGHVDYTTVFPNPLLSSYGCNMDYWQYKYRPSVFSTTAYCWKYTIDGYEGLLNDANINFKSTISVNGSGGSDSCTVSNVDSRSCSSGDGKVTASWSGNLVSGQSAPSPSGQDIIAIYTTSQGGWILSKKTLLDTWTQSKDNVVNCIDTARSTSCFDLINNAESNLLAGTQFKSVGGTSAVTIGSQNSGQVKLDLISNQIQFPFITMRIKADLIGINIPVGQPRIDSCNSDKFQTGSNGVIAVDVSNKGTGTGSFDVSASCTSGFSQSSGSLRISSLAQGDSQKVYIPITSNAGQNDIQGTCIITASDFNNPSNKDTKSCTVSSSAIAICNPDDIRASGKNIEQCQNNRWVIIKTCSETEHLEYKGTSLQCINTATGYSSGGSVSTGACKWYDISCLLKQLNLLLDIIKYIVLAAAVLLSFFFSQQTIAGILGNSNKAASWFIALLIAGGVGVGLYAVLLTNLFWIIAGVSVGIFVILRLIPFGSILRR